MNTFSPAVPPSVSGTDVTETLRLIENKFGDGYTATTPSGPNFIQNTVTLTWGAIHLSDLNNILTFLRANAGLPFYYQLPDESSARKWYVPPNGWKRSWIGGVDYSFSVQFVERFDNA